MDVTLKAPKGVTGCSVEGVEYAVKKGVVVVPAEAVAALAPHGFVSTDAEAQAEDKPAE